MLREEIGDSPRICHHSPNRQQNWWGKSRILPSNSANFVEDFRKRGVSINGRHISFPRGSLCLFHNAAGPSSAEPKSFQALRVPTMSPETGKSCPFLFHHFSACCVPPKNRTLSKAARRHRDCLKCY
ncbi:hypothetical protein E2C01_073273 [Portunus trituberculatus]|uniref:Uncharacterized protein n=1 Tax=Portunus trituberculatus TaxID=210409 RepID=A0A5B7I9E0_PORTR|nr:hypothetical protein [Portunus trituberculatus]